MKVSENFWNILAPIYDKLRRNSISGYFLKKENQAIEELFKNLLSYNIKTVCDLGVGRGNSLFLIPNTFPYRIAIDRSLPMNQHTRKESPDTTFINADVLKIPLKKTSIDLIVCIGLVEYIPDLDSLFNQVYSILKNEGHILLSYSPKKIITLIRYLRGHRIYPRTWEEIEKYLKKYHLELIDSRFTPLQYQCLLRKNN